MEDRVFRDAMGKFATGVTVVTTALNNKIHGMTVNAFMSVSLNPKLIVVSIDEKAHLDSKMKRTDKFAVSILTEDQLEVSMHFAGQKEKSNVEFAWFDDVPVIKNALTNIVCTVYDKNKVGDHILYVGEVIDLFVQNGMPLTFYEGKYGENQL